MALAFDWMGTVYPKDSLIYVMMHFTFDLFPFGSLI